jgi:hypothetical protein
MDPPHRDKSVDVGMNIGPAIRTTSTGSFTPRVSNHDEFPDVRRICRFLGHIPKAPLPAATRIEKRIALRSIADATLSCITAYQLSEQCLCSLTPEIKRSAWRRLQSHHEFITLYMAYHR